MRLSKISKIVNFAMKLVVFNKKAVTFTLKYSIFNEECWSIYWKEFLKTVIFPVPDKTWAFSWFTCLNFCTTVDYFHMFAQFQAFQAPSKVSNLSSSRQFHQNHLKMGSSTLSKLSSSAPYSGLRTVMVAWEGPWGENWRLRPNFFELT